jgi:hypothetical protein
VDHAIEKRCRCGATCEAWGSSAFVKSMAEKFDAEHRDCPHELISPPGNLPDFSGDRVMVSREVLDAMRAGKQTPPGNCPHGYLRGQDCFVCSPPEE